MPKLILRGAYIRFVDLRYDEKSKTVYTKLNFSASFSEPVRQAMEWGEIPLGTSSAKLDGEFAATHLILTPNGRELKQHEMQIDAKEIGNFELHRVTSEEKSHNELRFQVVTADPEAAAKLREYLAAIGRGEAQMRVNYEQNAELDLEDEEGQERLISEEQAEDTAADGPAIASAREASGSTPGRRKVRTLEPIQ